MGRASRASIKPTPLPLPPTRKQGARPAGNFPDGVKPMAPGDKSFEVSPPKPRPFK